MSWVAVGVAVVGGVASYAGQQKTNKVNAKNAKQQGYVDTTTTRNADPRSESYRDEGMQAAYNSLFGTNYTGRDGQQLTVQGDPNKRQAGPPANMSPKQAKQYAAEQARIAATGKGKKKGGAATGGTATPKKFEGMSGETDQIRADMMKLPEQNAGMYDASESYLTDTLNGQERNAYRPEAAEAARAIAADPELAAYQQSLRSGLGVGQGGGGSAGGVNRGRGASYSAPSWATGGGGSYGSATGTDAALKKLVAGEAPAGWEDMEAGISRTTNEGRAEIIRQLKANSVGSGFYGGSVYEDAMEGAISRGDRELADSLGAARFGAYQNALGLGTQYDLGMADMQSRERTAGASASASARAAADDLASRERLAMYGMWGDSIGLGQQGRASSAGALGDLAGLTSEDQRFAVGGVNDLGASRRGDLGVAGDLSLGADSNRNNYIGAQRQQQAANAGVNLGRQQLGFDKERFYDPLQRISVYGDLMNTFYGGLGSETTTGRDTRAAGGAAYSNPYGAALSGAALGAQVGSSFGKKPPTAGG